MTCFVILMNNSLSTKTMEMRNKRSSKGVHFHDDFRLLCVAYS